MSSSDIERNVARWTRSNAEYTDASAAEAWAAEAITWGVWGVPESTLGVLPELDGLDVVELGCGTAYFGAWLARRGARVVGVDPTPAQLETARRMRRETGLELELVQAPAEDVPLADASFDLAVSEYGASIWADPYRWIPEAARLLRPGGLLVFLRNSTLSMVCMPDEGPIVERLVRPIRGLYRMEWADDDTVEYHLPTGDLFALLRESGFDVERYAELWPPDDARDHDYYVYVPVAWARKWPAEEVWAARKRA